MRPKCGKLTGRSRYRLTWLGRLVLVVECEKIEHRMGLDSGYSYVEGTKWRDAKINDLDVITHLKGFVDGRHT